MLNINMQLERDNISAGSLQKILWAFVSSSLVYAARVYQTTLMSAQSSHQNEWLKIQPKQEITISRTTESSFEDETMFFSEQYVINLLYMGST